MKFFSGNLPFLLFFLRRFHAFVGFSRDFLKFIGCCLCLQKRHVARSFGVGLLFDLFRQIWWV